ncbi:MAG: transposase [Candidatus Dormibacteraceae bacterium]
MKGRETTEIDHPAGEEIQWDWGRLELFYLPPYSPQLNPDEWVWHNIKHDRVGKMAAQSLEEMKAGIERAVERLRGTAGIVLGFFWDPDLSYIAIAESLQASVVQ